MSIRVVLCDDQALVRSGFRMILEAREDIEVVGEAEDGAQALDLAWRHRPDVVLMDVRMPRLDGVEATRRLVESGSEARVLILTTFDLDEYVYEALLAPTVTRRLLDRFAQALPGSPEKPPPELSSLTEREREVLGLLAGGLSNAELAERLFLSETTVKTHVSSILRKLGLRDRVQAVVLAYRAGLVRPRSPG